MWQTAALRGDGTRNRGTRNRGTAALYGDGTHIGQIIVLLLLLLLLILCLSASLLLPQLPPPPPTPPWGWGVGQTPVILLGGGLPVGVGQEFGPPEPLVEDAAGGGDTGSGLINMDVGIACSNAAGPGGEVGVGEWVGSVGGEGCVRDRLGRNEAALRVPS